MYTRCFRLCAWKPLYRSGGTGDSCVQWFWTVCRRLHAILQLPHRLPEVVPCNARCCRTLSSIGIFNNFETSGSSLYNALQTQVQKRFKSGVSFLVNYSLSRMMSNTNSGFTSFASTALNKFNQKAEWTIDNNDQTHVVNISGVYELADWSGKTLPESRRHTCEKPGRWLAG